jgi:hypothetical protein
MPLTSTNFINKGPVLHADLIQFFNLFTGAMTDQPITFANVVSVGGSQAVSSVPLKLYGAVGQTTHLIDLYVDHTQSQPGFGLDALGTHAWGPSGGGAVDTWLSRVARQNGHTSDTAGILIQPYLEVAGQFLASQFQFPNGTVISSPSAFLVSINQDLTVQRNLLVSGYLSCNDFRGGNGEEHLTMNVFSLGAGATGGMTSPGFYHINIGGGASALFLAHGGTYTVTIVSDPSNIWANTLGVVGKHCLGFDGSHQLWIQNETASAATYYWEHLGF